jgi:hypothetical protein
MDAPTSELHLHFVIKRDALTPELQNAITALLTNTSFLPSTAEHYNTPSRLSGSNNAPVDIPIPPEELPIALSEVWLNNLTRRELAEKLGYNQYQLSILTKMVRSIIQAIEFKQMAKLETSPPWYDRLPDALLEMNVERRYGELRADYFVRIAGYSEMRNSTLRFKGFNMGAASERIVQQVAMYLYLAYC